MGLACEDLRDFLADGKEILAVFGLAISDKAKADKKTKFLYKGLTHTYNKAAQYTVIDAKEK